GEFRQADLAQKLLDLMSLFSLLLVLAFFKLGDEYLLVLIPFALFAAGTQLREQLARHGVPVILAGIAGLILVAFFMRYLLASSEAEWVAADAVAARGVPEDQFSLIWTWNSHHGAFDEYVASRGESPDFRADVAADGKLIDPFDDYFVWLA